MFYFEGFQCGRKADGFKLWLMWVGLGLDGFRNLVETAHESATYFYTLLRKGEEDKDEFVTWLKGKDCDDGVQTTNVYFWYIPPRLRGQNKEDPTWWEEIGKITVQLKERMVIDGQLLLGYAPLPHKNLKNALRLVLPAYPLKTKEHMDAILSLIRQYGESL